MPVAENKYDAIYVSPPASLGIRMDGDKVESINWLPDKAVDVMKVLKQAGPAIRVLDQYFTNPRNLSECGFKLNGTKFQLKVWQALRKIPPGQVVTYGELARKLNTSSRAIGQACRTNPIAVLIPCHRVVAADGPGGYMGKRKQLQIKQWLLDHERKCAG